MNGLASYRERRLELGDMIRAALHAARASGDAEAERRAQELLARLAADRFQLAIVGQFSRGKTTLINALLGGAYLPMGAIPMTSVITTVRYGSRSRALVRRRGSGLSVEVPLSDVAEYVGKSGTERAELQVAAVEVEVPAEILRLGFELVDTPGVGSALEANTATTRRFLPQADAVIFVTGFDSPLSDAEAGFLADAGRHAGRLFLVLNKRDLVSAHDAAVVTDFVRHQLRDGLELGEPVLFGLSALEALEAAARGDHERLSASGITALQTALTQFLVTAKTRLFLRNVADGGVALAAGLRRSLRLGRLSVEGGPHPSTVLTAFGSRMAELDQKRRTAAAVLTGKVEASLPGLLAARSPQWQASLRAGFEPCFEEAIGPDGCGPSPARARTAEQTLSEAGDGVAGDWLQRRSGEVLELLIDMVADQISVLMEVARAPRQAAAQIAGLSDGDGRWEPAGWTADDLPGLALSPPQWTVRLARPGPFGRRPGGGEAAFRRRAGEALTASVEAFEADTRTAFAEAARSWARRLDERTAQQARDEAAHVRRCLRARPSEEEVSALDELIARFRAAGDDPGEPGAHVTAGETVPAPIPQPAASTPDGCLVCERMASASQEYLRRRQFRLATVEAEQRRHAQTGGFCSRHTWQYAVVASPLGISASYAKLAATAAATLDSIRQQGGSAAELASMVAALASEPATCPLCALLAERERSVTAALAADPPVVVPVLCLRHLAHVLAASPPAETARAMIGALAATLRHDADRMRDYALKREALRSGLVTGEEPDAYRDALRRLAGLPAVGQPLIVRL